MKRCILIGLSILLSINIVKSQQISDVASGQAMFIYHFTKIIDWPIERKMSDFVIGVLGTDDIYGALINYTKQKRVAGQDIVIKRFNKLTEVPDDCHMLIITSRHKNDMPTIAQKLESSNTLLISNNNGAIQQGAAINLILIEDKIKYEVNSSVLQKHNLKYTSALETMAHKKY